MGNKIKKSDVASSVPYTPGGSLLEDRIIPGFIILLLASIMFPVFSKAREKAHQSTCGSNLKVTGLALFGYLEDYDGMNPPLTNETAQPPTDGTDKALTWCDALVPYMNGSLPECPEIHFPLGWTAEQRKRLIISGYTYSGNLAKTFWPYPGDTKPEPVGVSIKTVTNPALTIAVFDGQVGSLVRNTPDLDTKDANGAEISPAATRHGGGANYLFIDGHVKWFKPDALRTDGKSDGLHPGFGL